MWPTRDSAQVAGSTKSEEVIPTTSYIHASIPPELRNHPQYEVVRELGRGGMGVVYLATNKLMRRPEVLKVISRSLTDRPEAVERFLQEIRSAARLNHPNIVTAYTALQPGDLLVFAMEYVEGENLSELVKVRGRLPIVNACYYAQQAAQGLQHAADKGMVHRDIKPSNLMLAREGKKHILKILDFGLAKATSEKTKDVSLTGHGIMLGTPEFVAPEQINDARKADIRADIYSLGCTLYFMLAGKPPFTGAGMFDILQSHLSTQAKALNEVRQDVLPELAAVVAKMMAKDPSQRFQEPAEIVKALAPFVKPTAKKPDSPITQERPAPKTGEWKPSMADRVPPEMRSAIQAPARPAPSVDANVWENLAEASDLLPVGTGEQTKGARTTRGDVRETRREIRKSGGEVGSSARGSPTLKEEARRPDSRRSKGKARPARPFFGQSRWLWPAVGGGLLLILCLGLWAGGVFRVKTKDGVLIVEVNETNPDVYVDGDKVTVTWENGGKKAEVRVRPGTRKVQVHKDGFTVYGEDITLEDGGRQIMFARLDRIPPSPSGAASGQASSSAEVKASLSPPTTSTSSEDGFVPLFNGKDLSGLETNGNSNAEWQVEDGILVGRWRGEFAGGANLLSSRNNYQNFRFRIETKPSDTWPCAMVFLWPSDGRTEWYQAIMGCTWARGEGYETGVLRRGGVSQPLATVKNPPVLRDNEWFTEEVVVEGKRIRVYINNVLRSEYQEKELPKPGHVGIHLTGGVTLRIRKVEIQELPPTNDAPAPTAANSGSAAGNANDMAWWEGLQGYWFSENGAIVGRPPPGKPAHTFLVSKKTYRDFELRFQVRRKDGIGNSGVQFRSQIADRATFRVVGPQCEIDSAEYRFPPGSLLTEPNLRPLNEKARPAVKTRYKDADFNDFRIRCVGKHVLIEVNGITAIDGYYLDLPDEGVIAWQLHGGATPKEVTFRNVQLTELTASAPPPREKPFVPLFNGKDLTGWRKHPSQPGDWRVVDGILIGRGPEVSHLYTERSNYQDFHLRVEARINNGGNSGLFLRAGFGPNWPIKKPIYPLGYEAQIYESGGPNIAKTGSLFAGAGPAVVRVNESHIRPGQWFTMETIAKANRIVIKVNDKTTTDYTDEKRRFMVGRIALQAMDTPTVVEFRKIEIRD
jgi:serine/threonine protein kinase